MFVCRLDRLEHIVAIRLEGHSNQYVVAAGTSKIVDGEPAVPGNGDDFFQRHVGQVPLHHLQLR